MKLLRIGLLREEKQPHDSRVVLSPAQCQQLLASNPKLEIWVQPSPHRCIPDQAYLEAGLKLSESLEACDMLLGVKEVPVSSLIPNKTYLFFSHTIKKQPHNQKLLRAILAKNIQLIDYEVLTDDSGQRLIAFGHWAGVVGAHNGLMAWGRRYGDFELAQMKHFETFAQAQARYQTLDLKQYAGLRVVLTGNGRVSKGALQTLEAAGLSRLSPQDFAQGHFPNQACYTQLGPQDYLKHPELGKNFSNQSFYQNPQAFQADFWPYAQHASLLINGIFWDERAPRFFELEEVKNPKFNIRVIADISCDINGSVPTTLFASTIAEPVYGYELETGAIIPPYQPQSLDMMTIDNLPSELPYEASLSFGQQFIQNIWPELQKGLDSPMIQRACIANQGQLQTPFAYLSDYAGVSLQEK